MNFYELSAQTLAKHATFNFADLKNKVVLIVNVASKCGMTPQYEELEELNKKYKDQGLVVLGFPSNQFLFQEPGSESDIETFCQRNYGVSFQLFEKVKVNGSNSHPVYEFLKSKISRPGLIYGENKDIRWNFEKFLVDRNGEVVGRFSPTEKPLSFEPKIQELLKK